MEKLWVLILKPLYVQFSLSLFQITLISYHLCLINNQPCCTRDKLEHCAHKHKSQVSWTLKALRHFLASCRPAGHWPVRKLYFVPLAKTWPPYSNVLIWLWHCDTGFPYRAGQKSTQTWLAVPLVSDVSPDRGWAPLPHCQLRRPSVRLTQDGGGPARLLIKVMSCKIEREGSDSRLLPATLCFIVSARRQTFPLYLLPPVTVNGFVYAAILRLLCGGDCRGALLQFCFNHTIEPSLLVDCQTADYLLT